MIRPKSLFVLSSNRGSLVLSLTNFNFLPSKKLNHQESSVSFFVLLLWLIIFTLGGREGLFAWLVQEHHLLVNFGNFRLYGASVKSHHLLRFGLQLRANVSRFGRKERGIYSGSVFMSYKEAGFCSFAYRAAGI